jgi:hypothetical protein
MTGYPTSSSLKEDGNMSVPILVGHGTVIFGYALIEPVDIKRASAWRVLALTKALKNLSNTRGAQ